MKIRHVTVEGFKCIERFSKEFKREATLIGPNGSGKTTLLDLLATIAGNDMATHIYAGKEIGHVEVVFDVDGEERIFKTNGYLDRDAITEFKASLPNRINYAIPESHQYNFAHGPCDHHRYARRIKEFFPDGVRRDLLVRDQRACLMFGDGFKRIFRIMFAVSQDSGPIIMECPEAFLDINNQRIMSECVTRWMAEDNKQLIVTTHSPCWFGTQMRDHSLVDMK